MSICFEDIETMVLYGLMQEFGRKEGLFEFGRKEGLSGPASQQALFAFATVVGLLCSLEAPNPSHENELRMYVLCNLRTSHESMTLACPELACLWFG